MLSARHRLFSYLNLERWQVLPLTLAALAGLAVAQWQPEAVSGWSIMLWPLLALLMFVSFLHLDLRRWRRSLADRDFLLTILALNFLLLPLATALVLFLLPADPVIRLAVALVLLAPCTYWFLAFNLIGRGNPERATTAVPLLLLGQVVAVPIWLMILLGSGQLQSFEPLRFLVVFIGLFAIPLALALGIRYLSVGRPLLQSTLGAAQRAPLLFLLPVVFLVAATQLADLPSDSFSQLLPVTAVFLLWALLALSLALLAGRLTGLSIPGQRTLLFSAGSRNSFVVLPFALALPFGAELAAGVIMIQAMVELCLLILLTGLVPRLIR